MGGEGNETRSTFLGRTSLGWTGKAVGRAKRRGTPPENIIGREVEKRLTRPYCRSRQEKSCRRLPFPMLTARLLTRKKEIGKWKPSRHSRTFRIPSSTRHERNGTILRSIWSAA